MIESISNMWRAMERLEPVQFAAFTGLAAREIATCIEEMEISTATDRETLLLVTPMPFAVAMGGAPSMVSPGMPDPPEPFARFLHDAAAACRRWAGDDHDPFMLSMALGEQAATAVGEGADDAADLAWAIYRSYVEVLLEQDPLPAETEHVARMLFESGTRVVGAA